MATNRWMYKQKVVQSYNGILLDNKKKWSTDSCYMIYEPWKCVIWSCSNISHPNLHKQIREEKYKVRFLSNFTQNQERSSLKTWFGRLGKAPEKPWTVESQDFCPAKSWKHHERCLAGKIDRTWWATTSINSRLKFKNELEMHQVFWPGLFRMGVPRVRMGRRGAILWEEGMHSIFRRLKFEQLTPWI